MNKEGKTMKKMITRTFHPVGQGAFYTEKHIQGDECFNIVYDCGRLPLAFDWDAVINVAFKDGEAIDLLFISHFHEDHINGLEKLLTRCKTIKTVVIPFIDDEDKALFKFFNLRESSENQDYELLIDYPQAFFGGETNILKVISIEDEDQDRFISSDFVRSGEHINVGLLSTAWCFIPFNYNYGAGMRSFKEKLVERGLDKHQLETIEGILANKDRIKQIYKEIKPNINGNSLVLFSGMLVDPPHNDSILFELSQSNGHYLCQLDMNCLYLGDSDLKSPSFLMQLKRRLGGYYKGISTVQIPHHGSYYNFKIDILNPNPSNIISVITCGAKQKKHPSGEVLKQISVSGSTLFVVTEKAASKLTQEGNY